MHRSGMKSDVEAEADELRLFADNDYNLYRQRKLPILKNLALKREKGTYDSELAVKLFGYLADAAAKEYVRQMPDGSKWNLVFSPAARREASRGWRDEFEREYKENARHWLGREPRERRATPAAPARARKTARRAR